MRYSVRQSHCLRHMGLTPWVDRHVVPDTQVVIPTTDVQAPAVAPVTHHSLEPDVSAGCATVSEPAATTPALPADVSASFPESPARFLDWLRQQSMTAVSGPVLHGGQAALSLVFPGGIDAARDALPEQGVLARLLNDMLRSIGLRRRDVSLWRPCSVGDTGERATVLDGAALLAAPGVCLLVCETPLQGDSAESQCLDASAPLYVLPHPAALQREPARKRVAWNVLKQVRILVDSQTAPADTGD